MGSTKKVELKIGCMHFLFTIDRGGISARVRQYLVTEGRVTTDPVSDISGQLSPGNASPFSTSARNKKRIISALDKLARAIKESQRQ